MNDAILWLVLWAILTLAGTWAIYAVLGLLSLAAAAFFEKVWIAPLGGAIAFVLAAFWFVFAAVRTIQQIVSVVQIASGAGG